MEHLAELERVALTLRLQTSSSSSGGSSLGKSKRSAGCLNARQLPPPALTGAAPTHHDTAGYKNHNTARYGGLEVHGDGVHLALVERQLRKFANDRLSALVLLPFKRQHAGILVQVGQTSAIGLEQLIKVLQEGLRRRSQAAAMAVATQRRHCCT